MASKVELVVLGLLDEEPLYGYQVLQRFRDRSMGFWVEIGRASVYQSLQRLEREGSIVGRAQEGDEGPDRRVFRLTKAGSARLRAALEERFGRLAPFEDEAGTALGFIHLLSTGDARAALDARERAVRDLLDALTTERERIVSVKGPERGVAAAMLERQEALANAELAWLTSFRGRVGRLRKGSGRRVRGPT
jgi:DNA-binding PadR family transcriptional regulator